MPPFVANKKAASICSRWWEKWTLRVLDNFQVVRYIKGNWVSNTAAHRGAIQASCYSMTSKTNCTTMVFKKCCITTRTKELQALAWGSFSLSWLLSCLLPCQKQRDDYRSGISEGKRPYEGLPQAVRRISICLRFPVALNLALNRVPNKAR